MGKALIWQYYLFLLRVMTAVFLFYYNYSEKKFLKFILNYLFIFSLLCSIIITDRKLVMGLNDLLYTRCKRSLVLMCMHSVGNGSIEQLVTDCSNGYDGVYNYCAG